MRGIMQWSSFRPQKGQQAICYFYASQTLDETQINYATTEKGFLAVVIALAKFQSYLMNSKVIIFTDDAALKHLIKKTDSKPRIT